MDYATTFASVNHPEQMLLYLQHIITRLRNMTNEELNGIKDDMLEEIGPYNQQYFIVPLPQPPNVNQLQVNGFNLLPIYDVIDGLEIAEIPTIFNAVIQRIREYDDIQVMPTYIFLIFSNTNTFLDESTSSCSCRISSTNSASFFYRYLIFSCFIK